MHFTSIAAASGLTNTDLGTQNATVNASVYNLASPTINNTQPISFGIVHVGDAVTPVGLSITNSTPAGAFSEGLNAAFGTADTGITTNGGSITQLPAGQNNAVAMKVGIDTSTARAITGSATVTFQSDGTGINSLGTTNLSSHTVDITGQVNAYADPLFSKFSGDGNLSEQTPTHYLLNLGTFNVGDPASITLSLLNSVSTPADNLAGTFATSGAKYQYAGFGAISPAIAPGGSLDSLNVSLDTSTDGSFGGQVVFSPLSQNAAPFSGPLAGITIDITGTVNPVPEPCMMAWVGCAAMMFPRRKRRRG